MVLRLSGVMSLLQNGIKNVGSDEVPAVDDTICQEDFQFALNVIRFSADTCFGLLKPKVKLENAKVNKSNKEPVPEPENCTIEYLIANARVVRRVLSKNKITLSSMSRDKIYPVCGSDTGAHIARKFVNGLVHLRLGEFIDNGKVFKVYKINDENCPCKEEVQKIWKKLQMVQ